MKKRIQFIVNPFSGIGNKSNFQERIQKKFGQTDFEEVSVVYTEGVGHASLLTRRALAHNYEIVVAVGGDGAVNEIASELVHSPTVLGILPAGSGNGFAMHLGLGRNINRAMDFLLTGQVRMLDTCTLNGQPFVNLAGVGFDGHIAYRMRKSQIRGLMGYTKLGIEEALTYPIQSYEVNIDGETKDGEYLIIEVANAPMFGYNFNIAPQALPDDGLLEVVLVKKAPKWQYVLDLPRLLNHTYTESPVVERFACRQVTLTLPKPTAIHLDGEGFMETGTLDFQIIPNSLKVLVP